VEVFVDPGTIAVDRTSLTFASSGSARSGAQTVRVRTAGPGAAQMAWSATLIDTYGVLELRALNGTPGAVSGTGAGGFQVALRDGAGLPSANVDLGIVRVLVPQHAAQRARGVGPVGPHQHVAKPRHRRSSRPTGPRSRSWWMGK